VTYTAPWESDPFRDPAPGTSREAFSPFFAPSISELRIGAVVVCLLIAILSWVAWKGAHPDPALFMLDMNLSQTSTSAVIDRGPMPTSLVTEEWAEGSLSQFDAENLYVKINGRAGYYKSFGFEQLHFISLTLSADPQTAVDLELYDMGNAANAIGAYSGERGQDARSVASDAGLSHVSRNALYLTHGQFYLRAIGSDETPIVRSQLEHLKTQFQESLPSAPLPWGFAVLAGGLELDPSVISYSPANAFSFGFAENVYTGSLADEAEIFVTPGGDSASDLAEKFKDGFRQYGEDDGSFVKDRYLGTWATARAAGPWVVGIRGATNKGDANASLESISNAVANLPLPAGATEDTDAEGSPESDEY
jgi:hypothetical protein